MDMKARLGDTLIDLRVMRGGAFDYDVFIIERQVGGDSFVHSATGERVKMEPGVMMVAPTFSIQQDMAGDLVGQLLKMGVRPEGKAAPQDLLDAKDAHLRDLRALVFKGKVEPGG